MAGRPKGQPKTGGRKKGSRNRVTKAVKDMVIGALADAGGQAYLLQQAQKNPSAFMTLIGKVLPMDVTNSDKSMSTAPVAAAIIAALAQAYDDGR